MENNEGINSLSEINLIQAILNVRLDDEDHFAEENSQQNEHMSITPSDDSQVVEKVDNDISSNNQNKDSSKEKLSKMNGEDQHIQTDSDEKELKEGFTDNQSKISDSKHSQVTPLLCTAKSVFTVSKFEQASCKAHGPEFIGVDTTQLRLVCKKCVQEGLKGHDLELIIADDVTKKDSSLDQGDFEEDNINTEFTEFYECQNHKETNSSFYCDDCKAFICKKCFGSIHRKHNSNLPKDIAKVFKATLIKIMSDLGRAKPVLEENLEQMKSIGNKLNGMKEMIRNKIHKAMSVISETNQAQLKVFVKKLIQKFEGVDDDTDGTLTRLVGLCKKCTKYLNELEVAVKVIMDKEKQRRATEICSYRQSVNGLLKEILKLLSDSNIFLNVKVEKLSNTRSRKPIYMKEIETQTKSIAVYERSIISSIYSGHTTNSYVLRRFKRFVHNDVRYFKTTSIVISTDNDIFLDGLGVCGLYLSSKKIANPNNDLIANIENRGKIKVQISVHEYTQESGLGEKKFSESHFIYGIIQKGDPMHSIHFARGINLKKELKYAIILENLSDQLYCNLWCGSVSKESCEKMIQSITCNCSKVSFTFTDSKGIQSDFNEFTVGVIEGLMFSKIF